MRQEQRQPRRQVRRQPACKEAPWGRLADKETGTGAGKKQTGM
jgi:hypothetical protein